MKNLIEIHVLQNFAPSNLNRDDTGAPKDALFGGTRRARISSQCFKRAVREYFRSLVQQGKMVDHDIALRTKRVLEPLTSALIQMGRSENEARLKASLALAALSLLVDDKGKNQYLLFLGKREIQELALTINEKWEAICSVDNASEDNKKAGKPKKDAAKQFDPALKKAFEKVFNGGQAIDVALFGRMLTDMPSKNQDAACQVAHSISTHSVEREFDFYTAVDDLKPEEISGADMLGTVEFNSACFYRYSNIDFNKLVENLQGDKDVSRKALSAFLEAFVLAAPTGKQNTFAAHNPPEFVIVSVRQNGTPRNFANAFEAAIRTKQGESLTSKSAEELIKKGKILQEAFGVDGEHFVLNLVGVDLLDFGTQVSSLTELLSKTLMKIEE